MRLLVLPLTRPRIEVSSAAGKEVLVDVILLFVDDCEREENRELKEIFV